MLNGSINYSQSLRLLALSTQWTKTHPTNNAISFGFYFRKLSKNPTHSQLFSSPIMCQWKTKRNAKEKTWRKQHIAGRLAAKRQLIRLNGNVQCMNKGKSAFSTPTAQMRSFCQSPHSHSHAFVIELFKFRIIQISAHFCALAMHRKICSRYSFCVKCDNRNMWFGVMSFQRHVNWKMHLENAISLAITLKIHSLLIDMCVSNWWEINWTGYR